MRVTGQKIKTKSIADKNIHIYIYIYIYYRLLGRKEERERKDLVSFYLWNLRKYEQK
jgi:hypothetical protein